MLKYVGKTVYLKTDNLGHSYSVGIEGEERETETIHGYFEQARAAMINLINRTERKAQEEPEDE